MSIEDIFDKDSLSGFNLVTFDIEKRKEILFRHNTDGHFGPILLDYTTGGLGNAIYQIYRLDTPSEMLMGSSKERFQGLECYDEYFIPLERLTEEARLKFTVQSHYENQMAKGGLSEGYLTKTRFLNSCVNENDGFYHTYYDQMVGQATDKQLFDLKMRDCTNVVMRGFGILLDDPERKNFEVKQCRAITKALGLDPDNKNNLGGLDSYKIIMDDYINLVKSANRDIDINELDPESSNVVLNKKTDKYLFLPIYETILGKTVAKDITSEYSKIPNINPERDCPLSERIIDNFMNNFSPEVSLEEKVEKMLPTPKNEDSATIPFRFGIFSLVYNKDKVVPLFKGFKDYKIMEEKLKMSRDSARKENSELLYGMKDFGINKNQEMREFLNDIMRSAVGTTWVEAAFFQSLNGRSVREVYDLVPEEDFSSNRHKNQKNEQENKKTGLRFFEKAKEKLSGFVR